MKNLNSQLPPKINLKIFDISLPLVDNNDIINFLTSKFDLKVSRWDRKLVEKYWDLSQKKADRLLFPYTFPTTKLADENIDPDVQQLFNNVRNENSIYYAGAPWRVIDWRLMSKYIHESIYIARYPMRHIWLNEYKKHVKDKHQLDVGPAWEENLKSLYKDYKRSLLEYSRSKSGHKLVFIDQTQKPHEWKNRILKSLAVAT